MTHGLRKAGIDVIAGVDIDKKCRETYEFNNKPAQFVEADIQELSVDSFENGYLTENGIEIRLRRNDQDLLFAGCSPCQYWSLMNTDKSKSIESKNLLNDFRRFVEYYNPGYVLIENVPGLLSNATSPLNAFLEFLVGQGYFSLDYGVVKVADFGVPQTRKRFILIASRVRSISLPRPDKSSDATVGKFIGDKRLFPEIKAGHRDDSDFCHTAAGLSEVNQKRIEMTPSDGGSRKAWQDTDLQLPVYERHRENDSFGFQDIYGRMFWDRPAPTITTRFYSLSNGRFGHPEQNRALSLREGATLQTFPLDYVFKAQTITDISRIIGNAVPPELAKKIGRAILDSHS